MAGLYDLRQAEAAAAAGKATTRLNASFSAFDYGVSKLDNSRNFLMDDYVESGRMARRSQPATGRDSCWELLQYQKEVTAFEPAQGCSETKFHMGFLRRHAPKMPYLAAREVRRLRESAPREPRPRPSYNVLTSEGMDPSMDRAHGERRHTLDHRESREAAMHADATGGRLRDSTSRFFCTPDQLPHRVHRQRLLETDGLTQTKRTSTIIGVGSNPSQEIYSIGAREVLSDSIYGIQRRRAAKEAAAAVAEVRALP